MTEKLQNTREEKWADIAKNEKEILDLFKSLTWYFVNKAIV